MSGCDVVVVGGGVAGLAAAAALARDHRVLLCDQEPGLAAHASGRNAAIFRPLEADSTTAWLAARSTQLLREQLGELPLSPTGVLLVSADVPALEALCHDGVAQGLDCEVLAGEALLRRAPVLERGEARAGVWLPAGGVLDIHAITEGLARVARAHGASLQLGAGVSRLSVEGGCVDGVVLRDGDHVGAAHVVLAGGAWNARLGAAAGAPLALSPLRRHLVMLDGEALPRDHPVIWRLDDEVYFRPEAGGVLASPCDETLWEPADPPADPAMLERLSDKLARLAPALSSLGVRRFWACLRTFAPDRELCVGPDPRLPGLWWVGGLGGRGMGVAAAAGELLATLVRGETHALADAVSPGRLL